MAHGRARGASLPMLALRRPSPHASCACAACFVRQCVLCGVVLGAKMDSAETRWHCKHCGRSCCIKCAPNSSKRAMPKCVAASARAGTRCARCCVHAPHSRPRCPHVCGHRSLPLVRYGFQSPVRCCLECTELLDAQNMAVDAMEAALESRDLEAALALFDCRLLSIDYESASGLTPLILAVIQQRSEEVNQLLGMGASLNLASAVRNQTPLMAAVAEVPRDIDLLRVLVDRGASPAMVAADGNSALSLVRGVRWRRGAPCGVAGIALPRLPRLQSVCVQCRTDIAP